MLRYYTWYVYDILLNSMHEKKQFDLSSHNHQHSFSRWRSFLNFSQPICSWYFDGPMWVMIYNTKYTSWIIMQFIRDQDPLPNIIIEPRDTTNLTKRPWHTLSLWFTHIFSRMKPQYPFASDSGQPEIIHQFYIGSLWFPIGKSTYIPDAWHCSTCFVCKFNNM